MNPKNNLHVAIIMDGNGRWATQRGQLRVAGHRAGAEAVRRTVEAAHRQGVGTLTLFAFSADNWRRPPAEVTALMRLLRRFLREETERCLMNDVRIGFIGRRDRLSPALRREIQRAETATAHAATLHVRVAVDYSARDAILYAARQLPSQEIPSRETFRHLLNQTADAAPAPDVDLLIRTGGEQRLSDFLLWECAYAELLFTNRMWPDFDESDFAAALAEFYRRERRFGCVPAPEAATSNRNLRLVQ